MKQNLIYAAVALVGILAWTWYDLHTKPANSQIQSGVNAIIAAEPELRPLYDEAMSDGVLTLSEANDIINQADKSKGN